MQAPDVIGDCQTAAWGTVLHVQQGFRRDKVRYQLVCKPLVW